MRLIDRYLAVTVIRASLMTLLVLLVLLVFFGYVDEMDQVGRGDYQSFDAFLVALASAPRLSFEIFPVAALIGSLLGLGGLANHGELVAMRAAGVSLRHIVFAMLQAGFALMLVVAINGELLAPVTEAWAEKVRAEKQNRQVTFRTRYGFWARDGEGFVNIRRILPGNRLEDIFIYEFDDQRRLRLATHARYAEYRQGLWVMKDIAQSSVDPTGISTRRLEQATWASLIEPNLLSVVVVKPTMLPIWDLYRYIRFMTENGQSSTAYQVALWTKVATPLATLVMLVMGVPFVLGSLRSIGIGQRVFAGVLLGSVFFLLTRGFSSAALVYDLSPMLMSLAPAMLFLAGGLLAYRRLF